MGNSCECSSSKDVKTRSLDGIVGDGVEDEFPEEGGLIYSASDFPATLAYLNAIRARHNACPLEFDDKAAQHACACVQAMMDSGNMAHSNHKEYGEGQCVSFGMVGYWDMKIAIDKWMEEEYQYTGEFTASHYTQIVWKSSTGVGIAMGEANGKYWIAHNFSPAGNQWNQFADNVEADTGSDAGYDTGNDDTGDEVITDDGYQLSSNGNYYWKAAPGYDAWEDGYWWYWSGESADNAQWYSYN